MAFDFDYSKLLNLLTPANKNLVQNGIAAFDENTPIQRKPIGLFDTDSVQNKYPMKSEFNQDWALNREKQLQQDNQTIAPLATQLANTPQGGDNQPRDYFKAPESVDMPDGQIQTAPIEQRPVEQSSTATLAPMSPLTPNVAPQPSNINLATQTPSFNPNQPVTPGDRRVQADQALYDATHKDYSIKKDEKGNVTRGKDRDKDHNWWDVVKSIGLGALRGYGAGGLGGAIGGAITGGVGGGVDRNFDEKLGDTMFRIPSAQMNVERARQAEEFDTQQKLRQAQTATIPIDDENKRQQNEYVRQNNADRMKTTALTKLTSLKYFDPKNSVHAALATQAGLNPDALQGWDDRNPITKQVAGITYEYNRATKSFDPSNLPPEDRNTTTEYKVKMPDGEERTYKVAQKDAANFSTQMSALGARIDATATENEKQRTFQAGENEKARALARERMADMRAARDDAQKRYDDAVQRKDVAAQEKAAKDLQDEKEKRLRLKTYIKGNALTMSDPDLLKELDQLDDQ